MSSNDLVNFAPFESSMIKIERANKHIKELESLLTAFLEAHSSRIVRQIDPKSPVQFIALKHLEAPQEIPIIIGDIAHNLRSALDHVAGVVRARGGGNPNEGHFPISDTRIGTEKSVAKHIEPFDTNVAQVILDHLDCSDARNAPIWGINRINNIDKHRRIVLTITQTGTVAEGVQVGGVKIGRLESYNAGFDVVGVGGGQIKAEKDFRPTLRVTFGEPEPFQAKPVIPTLLESSEFVSEAVRLCAIAISF